MLEFIKRDLENMLMNMLVLAYQSLSFHPPPSVNAFPPVESNLSNPHDLTNPDNTLAAVITKL